MSIKENLHKIQVSIPENITLVVVTKTQPVEKIMEAYDAGYTIFGENKVQEMLNKYESLPKDIQWHLIGHLQTNKVKHIASFVSLIQSVDSLKLLQEINKHALKNNRVINCLLQIHIAKEEAKFGFDFNEAQQLIDSEDLKKLLNIRIIGLMGMSTNTDNQEQVIREFKSLKRFYDEHKQLSTFNFQLLTLSMGMSADYDIAIAEGSTMIRVGSSVFGERGKIPA